MGSNQIIVKGRAEAEANANLHAKSGQMAVCLFPGPSGNSIEFVIEGNEWDSFVDLVQRLDRERSLRMRAEVPLQKREGFKPW